MVSAVIAVVAVFAVVAGRVDRKITRRASRVSGRC